MHSIEFLMGCNLTLRLWKCRSPTEKIKNPDKVDDRYFKTRSFKLQPTHKFNRINREKKYADNQNPGFEMSFTHVTAGLLNNQSPTHGSRFIKIEPCEDLFQCIHGRLRKDSSPVGDFFRNHLAGGGLTQKYTYNNAHEGENNTACFRIVTGVLSTMEPSMTAEHT